jgi:hypothetical protein
MMCRSSLHPVNTALETQPIEVFRAGNYGAKGNFTAADLDRIASSYDPAAHEAPAVIGHPETNGPAYGWVRSLKSDGSRLMATFSQVDPSFAEMVEAGRFKKRSASFYRDPVTKVVTGLRHVGFLGAKPPDVKGLKDIQFHDEGHEVAEVTFEENEMAELKDAEKESIIDGVLHKFKALFPHLKPAAETTSFSEDDVKKIASEAATAAVKAAVDPLRADFAERESKIGTAETKRRVSDAVTKLKAAGKWVPAFDKMGLVVVFDELAKSADVVEFGEGEAKKSATALDTLVSFMEELPKIVPAAAVYQGQPHDAAAAAKKAGSLNPNGRAAVDTNSSKLNELATARAGEKKISYGDALAQVALEKPELTQPGDASVGAA